MIIIFVFFVWDYTTISAYIKSTLLRGCFEKRLNQNYLPVIRPIIVDTSRNGVLFIAKNPAENIAAFTFSAGFILLKFLTTSLTNSALAFLLKYPSFLYPISCLRQIASNVSTGLGFFVKSPCPGPQ